MSIKPCLNPFDVLFCWDVFESRACAPSPQIFLVTVWHWELFMLPLFLLLVIGWQYFQLTTGKASSNQEIVSNNNAEGINHCKCKAFGISTSIRADYSQPTSPLLLLKLHLPSMSVWRLILFTLPNTPQIVWFHEPCPRPARRLGRSLAPTPRRPKATRPAWWSCLRLLAKMPSLGNVKVWARPYIQCRDSATPPWPSGRQWHSSVRRRCHSVHHIGVSDDLI